ncbi:MAG: hypothetical protein ACI4J0_08430 [Huintestinicola sp.]|uniref:hypothetical protein n=1 Tax=Huintestinicola sp. TaxID=2981661 RepID=UPI003F10AF11
MENISVYLDNCCYNRPYDDQSQLRISLETQAKLHIQQLIVDKKLNLVYSYISVYENFRNPNVNRKTSISDFFKNASVYVDESYSEQILSEAMKIMETGVKKMDSLHIAAAIIGKADYFLSTDIRLLKYQSDKIKVINPVNFIYVPEV